jgi:thiol-disulfide isomerase/thioredoxin
MLFSMCLGPSELEDERAPDFTVLDTGDRAHNLTDYRDMVLVIEFFATWCGPCHSQLEELKDLRGRLPADRVAFLQIDSDDRESRSKVVQYVEDNDIPWPVAYNGGSVGADYDVDAIPTVVIVDGEGVVRHYNTGVVSADKLEEWIDELL